MTSRRIEKRGENGEENRFPSVGRLSSQADDGVEKTVTMGRKNSSKKVDVTSKYSQEFI